MPKSAQELEAKHLLPTYARYPLLLERGKGCWLYDEHGKKYLDLLGGIGVSMLGHAHPRIMKALREQAARAMHVSNLYYHPYQGPLAARLTKLSGLDRAFICNSGTEAWEAALKLARLYGTKISKEKYRFVSLTNSFHGRTMGSVATTGQEKYRHPYEPLIPGVEFVQFNDVDGLTRAVNDNTCAICLEVIQGEGGINEVTPEFLKAARTLADRHGALLILDEIQCGLGRTGRWFGYQNHGVNQGVKPDIITLAKPLAAGFPLGAMLATEKAAAAMTPGMHGTTFGGGPLGCRLALEFLDVMEQDHLLSHIKKVGGYFHRQLVKLKKKYPVIREVRGRGLMLAADLSVNGRPYVDAGMKEGLLFNSTHDTVLRFLPPYIITQDQIDFAMRKLDGIFADLGR
jgi:acetylornithine/N-succinyldiaminopimelate aminotransferase